MDLGEVSKRGQNHRTRKYEFIEHAFNKSILYKSPRFLLRKCPTFGDVFHAYGLAERTVVNFVIGKTTRTSESSPLPPPSAFSFSSESFPRFAVSRHATTLQRLLSREILVSSKDRHRRDAI